MPLFFAGVEAKRRRVRGLMFRPNDLLAFLAALDGSRAPFLRDDLPHDATVVAVEIQPGTDAIVLTIQSAEYDPILDGDYPPQIDSTVDYWTLSPEERIRQREHQRPRSGYQTATVDLTHFDYRGDDDRPNVAPTAQE